MTSIDSPVRSDSSFWKVFLSALFFGVFGVHRFITGKTRSGLIQLFTFGFCGLWSFVDLFNILLGKFTDKNGDPIQNPNPKASWAIVVTVFAIGLGSGGGSSGGSRGSGQWIAIDFDGKAKIDGDMGYVEVGKGDGKIIYLIETLNKPRQLNTNSTTDKSWESTAVVKVRMNGVWQTGLFPTGPQDKSPAIVTYNWAEKPEGEKLIFKSIGTGDTYSFKRQQ